VDQDAERSPAPITARAVGQLDDKDENLTNAVLRRAYVHHQLL